MNAVAEPGRPDMDLAEYLDEIRRVVCSHCIERPPGGPPCAPLGKVCGIELHTSKIVETVLRVRRESGAASASVLPYLDQSRMTICRTCSHLHGEDCPCPMETLAVLLVEAVETVADRHDAASAPEDAADE